MYPGFGLPKVMLLFENTLVLITLFGSSSFWMLEILETLRLEF